MPLRIELKPFERIVIGEAVLINSGTRTSFMIDGDAPILREKHTLAPENANTPAKRLYICVQAMYLKNDIPRYRTVYQRLLQSLSDSQPADRIAIEAVDDHVSNGALYKALKEIRKLMKSEERCRPSRLQSPRNSLSRSRCSPATFNPRAPRCGCSSASSGNPGRSARSAA